ncbi:MAG: GNAT family N-acetyltransferase [Candidatus Saccharimonadales bacterium]
MITIVPAKPEDVKALADLLEETDRFYGGTEFEPVEKRIAQISTMVFREQPAAHVLLAKDGDRAVGYAAYSFLWPAADLTQSLYLKELYVSEVDRRSGVGKLLMDELVKIAKETGCGRVEWTADRDNPLAVAFYERHGYLVNEGKMLYRLTVSSTGV